MRKSYLLLFVFTVFFFFSCKKDTAQLTSETEEANRNAKDELYMGDNWNKLTNTKAFVPNQVIVKYKKGSTARLRGDVLAKINGNVTEHLLTQAMENSGDKEGLFLVHTSLEVTEAMKRLKGPEIEYAEPNFIYTYGATSNDNYYTNGSLWGMYGDGSSPANSFGSQAAEAWTHSRIGSDDVYVGIIDEGVMHSHEDLSANFWTNPNDPVDKIDNDRNGYVDDVRGWDFVSNNNSVFDGVSDDHGTHVAGTIGAKGGNGRGVAGVVWNVKLISAKFLGPYGGTTANAIKAIDYFTDLKTRHGIKIAATNNSWGGGGYSQALKDAITRAGDADILFIAAAGNDSRNTDASLSYPASYDNDNIIAVASITSAGNMSSFSNYGLNTVDIGAPGSAIYSTVPASGKGKTFVSSYSSYSGTSMATPHVTGAAALYKSIYPNATAAQIKAAILNKAVTTPALEEKCTTGGRLDVSNF